MQAPERTRKGPADAVRRLDMPYVTPERRYAVYDLAPLIAWSIGLGIYGAWAWLAIGSNPFGWTGGERLVAALAGIAGAYGIASWLGRSVAWSGGGGIAVGGGRRLRAEFVPGRFRIRMGRGWQVFDAGAPHAFSMRPHMLGYEEGRAEERARADSGTQGPDFYRRSWEILLDYRVERIVLAAVADEDAARRIVRSLQTLDSYARGMAGAGTRTGRDGPLCGAPSGRRPKLD